MSEAHDGAAEAVTEDTAAAEVSAAEETTPAQGDEQSGEDTAATEGEPKPEKVRLTATERVQQAVARQREAEREAEFWRSKATQSPQPAPQPTQADAGKPDPADFTDGAYDPAYIDALTDWKAEQAVEKRFSQREAQTRTQTALQTFEARVAEQYPDGEPAGITALRRAPTLPASIFDLVTSSEIGPKLAEHLGDHPREFANLSAMPPHLQGREIAKLEAKLATPAAPVAKTATDAPLPTAQVRGAGGQFKPAPDTEDFGAFQNTYGAKGA